MKTLLATLALLALPIASNAQFNLKFSEKQTQTAVLDSIRPLVAFGADRAGALEYYGGLFQDMLTALANGELDRVDDYRLAYRYLVMLQDSTVAHREYALAARGAGLLGAGMDSVLALEPHPGILADAIKYYGACSWYSLFIRDFPGAELAARRALELENFYAHVTKDLPPSEEKNTLLKMMAPPSVNWVRTNLGHSYLYRGQWKQAKAIYETYLAGEKDPEKAKATLLKDFAELEAAGVKNKTVKKARKWLE